MVVESCIALAIREMVLNKRAFGLSQRARRLGERRWLKIQTPKVVEAMFPAALGAVAPKSNSDIQGLISADAPFNVQLDKG